MSDNNSLQLPESVGIRGAIFYDFSITQLQFAAREGGAEFLNFPMSEWRAEKATRFSLCFVIRVKPDADPPQSYVVHREGNIFSVTAPHENGAMYGALSLIEAHKLGVLETINSGQHKPYIDQRGIKLNIPLDARTPSYSDPADAAQANIAEMWSMDFWRCLLDEMARHYYNVLSLWNLHPFPSIVKVPEYPDVALTDVTRTTHKIDDSYSFQGIGYVRPEILDNLEVVKTLSMDEKIRFWQDVMQYAKDRGIDVYIVTWNIFTYGATGKYGITDAQTNQNTVDYMRACVRETVLTYPLLSGMGITAGEQMNDALEGESSREGWLWRTYGEGIRDAIKIQPDRKFRLIHRFHQSDPPSEVVSKWKDLPAQMDFSFKYSGAHMLSVPNPGFIAPFLKDLPKDKKTWLTIRNDDVYSFRWGDSEYVREYIKSIPSREKIAGFFLGPDGDTWGREIISKAPTKPRQLTLAKHWYFFFLWSRLSFDPDLPVDFLKKKLEYKFSCSDAEGLMRAWSAGSQVFALITRFFWDASDVRWYPEGCLSHPRYKGYYTVRDFIEGSCMPGSGVRNILEWRKSVTESAALQGTSPIDIANELERCGKLALEWVALQRAPGRHNCEEFLATLGDIEAMAQLACYYRLKILGASALALFDRSSNPREQENAVNYLRQAALEWVNYADTYSEQYTSPHLYNRVGFVDLPGLKIKAHEDVQIARHWNPGTIAKDAPKPNRGARLIPDVGGNKHRVLLS